MTIKKGQKAQMTDDAVDNYGEKYRGKWFTVQSVAFSKDDHPGYDDCIPGEPLYDFEELPFSLYGWELR